MSSALVMDRFTGTAILDAGPRRRDLGVIGVVGRASGLDFDARIAHPLADFGERFSPAVQSGGDVLARFCVRVDEVRASLALLADLIGRPSMPSMWPRPRGPQRWAPSERRGGYRRGLAGGGGAPGGARRRRPAGPGQGGRPVLPQLARSPRVAWPTRSSPTFRSPTRASTSPMPGTTCEREVSIARFINSIKLRSRSQPGGRHHSTHGPAPGESGMP